MAETVALSVKLPIADKKRLAKIAKQTKRSSHYIMREAIQKHLDGLQDRLDFLREAQEAWKDYEETGLYYSQEDMLAWAKSGGGELPPARSKWEK